MKTSFSWNLNVSKLRSGGGFATGMICARITNLTYIACAPLTGVIVPLLTYTNVFSGKLPLTMVRSVLWSLKKPFSFHTYSVELSPLLSGIEIIIWIFTLTSLLEASFDNIIIDAFLFWPSTWDFAKIV